MRPFPRRQIKKLDEKNAQDEYRQQYPTTSPFGYLVLAIRLQDDNSSRVFLKLNVYFKMANYADASAASSCAYNARAPRLTGPNGSGNRREFERAMYHRLGSHHADMRGSRLSAEEAWLSSITETLRNWKARDTSKPTFTVGSSGLADTGL
jgi:hypothetical protein